MTSVELWAILHGMVLGSLFIMGFSAGFMALWRLSPDWLTTTGIEIRARRLPVYAWIMAASLWLTVLVGTYLVYPAYRAPAPEGLEALTHFPRSFLLSDPSLAVWHSFGMEWKEHIAWLAPILATAVAGIATRYRAQLAEEGQLRRYLLVLTSLAFVAAGVAGLLGALINKAAPVQ